MSHRDRSIANMRCEAKRIYNQRRYINKLEKDKKELQQRIDKAIGNWNTLKRYFEFLKINTTGGNKEFMEDILKLMNILEGDNNEKNKN